MTSERARRLAESILENETLTEDLDDSIATPVIQWAVACAEYIGKSAFAIDEGAFEIEVMPRMRALRRMVRHVGQWLMRVRSADEVALAADFELIKAQAITVYGVGYRPPDNEAVKRLLDSARFQSPSLNLQLLRQLIDAGRRTLT